MDGVCTYVFQVGRVGANPVWLSILPRFSGRGDGPVDVGSDGATSIGTAVRESNISDEEINYHSEHALTVGVYCWLSD